MQYTYPAVFQPSQDGFTVWFPALPGCITEGDTPEEALFMAQDALCLYLYDKEESSAALPSAEVPCPFDAGAGCFVRTVSVDTDRYRL